MPRAKLRQAKPADPDDVPPELIGLPERMTLARTMSGLKVSDVGSSRIERGERLGRVSAVKLARMAVKLGVRVGWLIRNEQPMYDGRNPPTPTPPPMRSPSSVPPSVVRRDSALIRAEEGEEQVEPVLPPENPPAVPRDPSGTVPRPPHLRK